MSIGSPRAAASAAATAAAATPERRLCGFCEGYGYYSYFPLGTSGVRTERCSDCDGAGFVEMPSAPQTADDQGTEPCTQEGR